MVEYDVCTDFVEIISGTKSITSPVYMEASKSINSGDEKSLKYLKNFIISIENIASDGKVKDERISTTKGNIRQFKGYKDIETTITFLKKNFSNLQSMKDLVAICDALENYQSLYTAGYEKNVRLIILEYECGLYLLVTGLASLMANGIDVVQNGVELKVKKKSGNTSSMITKTIHEMAKQMSNKQHKDYLKGLLDNKDNVKINTDIKESVILESLVSDTVDLLAFILHNGKNLAFNGLTFFNTIKRSLFGIIPLIRSVLYLKYKRKADIILALEEQAAFIKQNVEQLEKTKGNMNPNKKEIIIKRQKAVAEAYMKRAAKLRAELIETERDASEEIKKEDPKMKDTSSSDEDEFVLEGMNLYELFE